MVEPVSVSGDYLTGGFEVRLWALNLILTLEKQSGKGEPLHLKQSRKGER